MQGGNSGVDSQVISKHQPHRRSLSLAKLDEMIDEATVGQLLVRRRGFGAAAGGGAKSPW